MKKLFLAVFIAFASFFTMPAMAADLGFTSDWQTAQPVYYEKMVIADISAATVDRPDNPAACGNCHTQSGITDKLSKIDHDKILYNVYAKFHTSGFERKHRSNC